MTFKKIWSIYMLWMFPSNIFAKFIFWHNNEPSSNLGIPVDHKDFTGICQPQSSAYSLTMLLSWMKPMSITQYSYYIILFSFMFHEDLSLVLHFLKSHNENWPRLYAVLITICRSGHYTFYDTEYTTSCSHFLWNWDKIRRKKRLKISLYQISPEEISLFFLSIT